MQKTGTCKKEKGKRREEKRREEEGKGREGKRREGKGMGGKKQINKRGISGYFSVIMDGVLDIYLNLNLFIAFCIKYKI